VRASVSSTTTTSGDAAVCCAVKLAPRTSGIRSVRKYSGSTTLMSALGASWIGTSLPSTQKAEMLPMPANGSRFTALAASTPGIARIRGSSSSKKASCRVESA
jgi:hypothetical protein